MNIYDRRNEVMAPEDRAQAQIERLQALLARVRRNVPRYRKALGRTTVESLDALGHLPVTTPEDLAAAFPYGMFALPLREVIRLHSVIGPNGMQLVIGLTRNDLTQWGRLAARQLVAAGASPNDVIHVCFGGGSFGRALGYMLGAELIGASVIPQDTYHIEYQLAMMQSYRPSMLITTPSNARELVDILHRREIDPQSLPLRTTLLSRPVTDAEREELARDLFSDVRCSFGLEEVMDPGLCVECSERRFHVNEDQFLAETDGGELLVTTLSREAMPLLRYRTRTRCELRRLACPCGRTGAVLSPGGRMDGRLRVNEMPLYECQIQAVLNQTRAGHQPFRVEITESKVTVVVMVTEGLFPDTVREMESLKRQIESEFQSRLGIVAEVAFAGPREFRRTDTVPAG